MSANSDKKMLRAYYQDATPMLFLSGHFQTPRENFHTSESVEIDIVRSGRKIAIAIESIREGARLNSSDQFTNKEFTPPVYDELLSLSAYELFGREPGRHAFDQPSYQAKAISRAFRSFRLLQDKVMRSVELQASQVLQTGTNTLLDSSGNTVYSIDFKPKATHFPTAATGWDEVGADPLGDISALAKVINTDGLRPPDKLIFGDSAWEQFINNTGVQAQLDNRRYVVGEIKPVNRGEGATFQGYIFIGNYRYEMWTYDGEYEHPQTGVATKFVGDENVIVMNSGSRLDLTYGSIPLIVEPQTRALRFMPRQFASTNNGFGFTTNAYTSLDGKHLFVGSGTRPLCIPTAIDQFGMLDTNIT